MTTLSFAVIGLFIGGASLPTRADQFYATEVVSRTTGSPNQAGFQDPSLVLGGPRGAGDTTGSFHVLNLGVGGQVTLGFNDGLTQRKIADAPGADFIVFENAFYAGGNTTMSMAELVFVEVSTNGSNFARFPVQSATPSAVSAFGTINPANVSGFAGAHPNLANVDTNAIDPFDPSVAGGDAFDLSALTSDPLVVGGMVLLNDIRFVRLIDVLGNGTLLDASNRPIFDATGSGNAGADVDAIAVVHGATVPEPCTAAVFVTCAFGALRRRRRC